MSREIGYRAWHKEDKKMLHVCGMDWMVNLERDCVEISAVNCAERRSDGWVNGGSHDIEDVILMQDTGIKDKNGVKIYEGDVVLHSTAYKDTYVVSFKNGSLIANHTNASDSRKICPLMFDRVEVIGNIHEKELLSKKESK